MIDMFVMIIDINMIFITIIIKIIITIFQNIGILIIGTMMILTGRRGHTGQAARWGGRPVDQLIFT